MVHVSIKAETLFHIAGLPVTNTMLTAWAVMVLLVLAAFSVYKGMRFIPKKTQNFAEWAVESITGFLETITGNRRAAERFFPIVATIFIYILAANWLGVVPGIGAIGIHKGEEFIPFFRSMNSDLNMTLALAIAVVVLSHIYGLYTVGAKKHLGKFITLKSPIAAFTGFLEIISELSKVISLSFRLFGNILAGEVLLVIVGVLVPYVAPIPFLGMELFVGIIQAAIFAVLAIVAFASFAAETAH